MTARLQFNPEKWPGGSVIKVLRSNIHMEVKT